ncbi:MAG TPA: porin, partial [Gammaproteobacteria bacterium]|nr:porin [Gammaproteobacteria bacterium]
MYKKVLTAAALAAVCAAGSTSAMAAAYTSPDGSTTLGAKIYGDFTSHTVKQDGQKVNPSGLGFDVKRFYFNVNHDFDSMWSVRLRTDARYTDAPNGSGQPNVSVYVKQAYLQAKFSNAFKLSLGENDMPWIPFEEHMYGFRYVENTLIDRTHFGNSADFGLHANGKTPNGMVDYNVAIVNGSGYHSDKRSRSVDFAGRIDAQFVPGLHTALGFYNGKRGENVYSAPGVQVPTQNTTRWDALVAWIQPKYRVGASYF